MSMLCEEWAKLIPHNIRTRHLRTRNPAFNPLTTVSSHSDKILKSMHRHAITDKKTLPQSVPKMMKYLVNNLRSVFRLRIDCRCHQWHPRSVYQAPVLYIVERTQEKTQNETFCVSSEKDLKGICNSISFSV